MRVVYVAGWGRSGSTVLDRVLGALPDLSSLGELRDVSDGKPLATHRCACGLPVPDCPFWQGIIPAAMDEIGADERRLHELLYATSRQRYLPRIAFRRWKSGSRMGARLGDQLGWGEVAVPDYARFLYALYEGVIARSGKPGIVDSSKSPSDALLLSSHPGIELHLIHLVRDPRGPAYSWSRVKGDPGKDGDTVPILTPSTSSKNWLGQNLAVELFLRRVLRERYHLVRYEDLMAEPHEVLRQIAAGIGSRPEDLPLSGSRDVALTPCHTIGGNPVRFATGTISLEPDLRWQKEMSTTDRLSATVPALPLLRRYHYPIWVGAGDAVSPDGTCNAKPGVAGGLGR